MPLTEDQRRLLQRYQGTGQTTPSTPGLPPNIQAIAAVVPSGKPYLKSLGRAGGQIAYPMPPEAVAQQLGMEAARQQVRQSVPKAGEVMKRDFARIDAFEGILGDLEALAKSVRKGPIQGSYVKLGSKVTGGGQFPDVQRGESE